MKFSEIRIVNRVKDSCGRSNLSATIRSVETNAEGGFSATFSFSFSVEGKTILEVAFQAHIVNATILAPADSNIVHYRAMVGGPKGPDIPK